MVKHGQCRAAVASLSPNTSGAITDATGILWPGLSEALATNPFSGRWWTCRHAGSPRFDVTAEVGNGPPDFFGCRWRIIVQPSLPLVFTLAARHVVRSARRVRLCLVVGAGNMRRRQALVEDRVNKTAQVTPRLPVAMHFGRNTPVSGMIGAAGHQGRRMDFVENEADFIPWRWHPVARNESKPFEHALARKNAGGHHRGDDALDSALKLIMSSCWGAGSHAKPRLNPP